MRRSARTPRASIGARASHWLQQHVAEQSFNETPEPPPPNTPLHAGISAPDDYGHTPWFDPEEFGPQVRQSGGAGGVSGTPSHNTRCADKWTFSSPHIHRFHTLSLDSHSLPIPPPNTPLHAGISARMTMGTHPGLTQRCLGLKWGIRVGRGPVRVRHRTTRGVQANDLFPFPLSLSPRFFYAVRVH